ncbi:MAG: nickel transporter permease [Anaerolineae bacterium]
MKTESMAESVTFAAAPPKVRSLLADALLALLGNRTAMLGALILLAWVVLALGAEVIAPHDPLEQDVVNRLRPPSPEHLCGTDELGRDILSRVVYGARISLPMGVFVIFFAACIGGAVGAFSGYLGGLFDEVAMRIADVTLAFPSIVLALAIAAALGPSLRNALLAMVAVWWPEYARVMRGQVLAARYKEYVVAARSIGATESRILFVHILPNAIAPIVVKATLDIGNAILLVAALSFIGLGAVPPTPEWGAMIAAGRQKFYQWWMATFPGLAILSVVMGFNFLGDGLRDTLDPYLRGA